MDGRSIPKGTSVFGLARSPAGQGNSGQAPRYSCLSTNAGWTRRTANIPPSPRLLDGWAGSEPLGTKITGTLVPVPFTVTEPEGRLLSNPVKGPTE